MHVCAFPFLSSMTVTNISTFCIRRIAVWAPVMALCGAVVSTAQAQVPASNTTSPSKVDAGWTVLVTTVPVPRAIHFPSYLTQQLQRELQQKVQLKVDERDYGLTALVWAHQPPDSENTIVMLSEGNSSVMGSVENNPRHLLHYTPLVVFMEMPWCLYGLKASPASQRKDFGAWMQELQRPVRVGVSVPSGKPMLWLRALEVKHGVQVKPELYSGAGRLEAALQDGVDFAIGRCSQTQGMGKQVLLLGQAQRPEEGVAQKAPLFTELGLPPLERGWYGAFAANSMPVAQRDRLVKALERIARMPQTAQEIESIGQIPLLLDHQRSQQYISQYVSTWQSVSELMERDGVPSFKVLPVGKQVGSEI